MNDKEIQVYLLGLCITFVVWIIILEIIPPVPLGWIEIVMAALILGVAAPMAFFLILGWPMMMAASIEKGLESCSKQ